MTAYFDDFSSTLRDLRHKAPHLHMYDEANALEERLVRDCTLASSASRFPPELRKAVHVAVLRHGVCTLPINAVPADFETWEEHLRRLHNLGSDLHDVFHALVRLDIGYSDTPTAVTAVEWISPREDERERLAAEEFGGKDPAALEAELLQRFEGGEP